ncbi:MAG: MBL fold metallo-hydrolase [Paludibacteraceae bacterium]|nr:MBL fold metallo-hydrolase [Paludibacteraceae bacterium]
MKALLIISGVVLVLGAVVLGVLSHPAFGVFRHVSRERIEASPNYRNGRFRNQEPTPQFTGSNEGRKGSFGAIWRFLTAKDTVRIPNQAVEAYKTDLKALPTDSDWVVWFGHSSYLFCLGGKRFLVDPLLKPEFPASVMLRPFAGTDIYRPEDLPPIDVLIITHEHWDHMDYGTLRDLRTRVKKVVCPLGIADYLRYWHYPDSQIVEMDWSENSQFSIHNSQLSITCLPTRHFSNRLLGRANQTLWASFMIEYAGRKVYIGGDGGYDGRFKAIREQFGEVDLAFLENGQYNERWRYIHTMPEGLEQAIRDLEPKQVFTVHHDKYALAMHPWNEPDSVAKAISRRNPAFRLLDAAIGKVVFF